MPPAGKYIVARSSRPACGPGREPGGPGDHPGRIAGNMHWRNPDIRSRLSAFTGQGASGAPRVNVTHIGPEQARNARPCDDRGQHGELMILILPGGGQLPGP